MLVSSSEVARLHPDRGRVSAADAGGQAAVPSRRGRLRSSLGLGAGNIVVDQGACSGSSGSNGWIDYVTGHGRSTRRRLDFRIDTLMPSPRRPTRRNKAVLSRRMGGVNLARHDL